MTDPFRAALDTIPEGYGEGIYRGRRYRIEKAVHSGGHSIKLVASELGGTDYISLNLYLLASGTVLKPCEMPEAKVRDFVLGIELAPPPLYK